MHDCRAYKAAVLACHTLLMHIAVEKAPSQATAFLHTSPIYLSGPDNAAWRYVVDRADENVGERPRFDALTKVTFLWGPLRFPTRMCLRVHGLLLGTSAANARSSPLPTTMSDYSVGDT